MMTGERVTLALVGAMLSVLPTGHCQSLDMCARNETILHASDHVTLLVSDGIGHACRCLVDDESAAAVVRHTTSLVLNSSFASDQCPPGVLVHTDTLGYTVCSGTSPNMEQNVSSQLVFQIHNPNHIQFQTLTAQLQVIEGSVSVTCGDTSSPQADSCLCDSTDTSNDQPLPAVGDVPIRERLIAGFVSVVVFLVCLAVLYVLYRCWKRHKSQNDSGTGDRAQAVANPGFTLNESANRSYLSDVVDPTTGRTVIRFDPDPSLNLAIDPSYSSLEPSLHRGSNDSGLYSVPYQYPIDTDEISPYASTASTLQRARGSQPALAGCGDVDSVYSGYDLSYTQSATLPSGYTTQKISAYPAPSYSDIQLNKLNKMTPDEVDALYAKPIKRPRSAVSDSDTAPGRSRSYDHIDADMDPPDAPQRLDDSSGNSETEV